MSRASRTVAAIALAALFFASTPAAAAALPMNQSGAVALWNAAWQWLEDLILPGGQPDGQQPGSSANGDAGGTIDPDGVRVNGVDRGSVPDLDRQR
ncbi:MAG TPA: hypothetical protein VE078_07175 [Thermoanaerobaculia bacterium]|nr:hypothetical protein [Thermoanaerobaculia bacterium]